MRKKILTICICLVALTSNSQNISINNTGNSPDESAMLDIQSTEKGILIPRMTSTQREDISMPANGLLVFDITSQSFWFYESNIWTELIGPSSHIVDLDNDTEVNVETTPDEDAIRMHIEGEEALSIIENATNAHRFHTYENSRNLFFGHNSGINSTANFNTFLGYESGLSNVGGGQNSFIGYQAGMDNIEGDGNVALGYRAGYSNIGSFNVFVGRHSGYDNEDGDGNVFLGYNSGSNNIGGSNNVFLGYNSGQGNNTGIQNTFVGQGSGFYNTTGSENTFIGEDSGRRNRTGNRNVALGNNALGPNLSSGDHGDGNTALGYNTGFSMTASAANTYVGENAGYFNSVGDGNTMIGNSAGQFMRNGRHNTALGYRAYRTNNGGNNNIAIGDSAMFNTLGDFVIAIGDKAGEQAYGSSNIFIGQNAGANNGQASQNIFIGGDSGFENSRGILNTFIGIETGRFNNLGTNNEFLGFRSGFRNTDGNQNTYIGSFAGQENTRGNNNVSIGFQSLYGNTLGSGNVGLGHNALSNLGASDGLTRIENTAVGFESGNVDLGNYNVTLGSKTQAGDNQYNVAIGYEASTTGGVTAPHSNYGIAIGYQTIAGGEQSIAIGKNTFARNGNIFLGNNGSQGVSGINAVGIGNNVLLTQPHSVILGDINDQLLAVGIGTNTPVSKLTVNNPGLFPRVFTVQQNGEEALDVYDNRSVSIGGFPAGPSRGLTVVGNTNLNSNLTVDENVRIGELLYVNTNIMPTDYSVAIDGKVACTEIRVQAVDQWPDYVFEKDYPLLSLKDLRTYITENKHLPGIPSAKEVHTEGFEIGKTQEILLEKIEELSLYILQLEERLSSIENQNK